VLDRSGDRLALARAHFRRGGWYYSLVCAPHEVGASFRRGLEILDEAGIDSRSERDPARAALAWAEAVGGDPERAAVLIDEIEAAGEPVDELAAIELGRARATALARQERFAESFGPGVTAAEAAERGGWPELAYGCWLNAAGAAVCAGELERALAYVERCLHGLSGTGLAPLEIQALCARAWVLARSGRFTDAQGAATNAAELARRIGDDGLLAAAENELGRVALARGNHSLAAERYAAALAGEGPFSRPITRLERAAALARLGRCEEAERELRDAALEPVRPGDWPDTLVARICHVQGLVAAALGDHTQAVRRLQEAADGWRHRVGAADAGERWSSALADLGRPVVGVVEPERELRGVLDDLEGLAAMTPTEV
jgi:tetratricopeptide (TPR) repeat protein